ncbi:MAG: DNA-directed DNA polymerase II small subunit [Candidatus Thermoplasmatota archaeon]|nr:DNA-directed DNA polymerase II small subunit [Candidatus Thermoplasmatota archaeon]
MRDKIVSRLAENDTVMTPDAWEYLNDLDHSEDLSVIIDKMEEEKEELPFPVCKDTVNCFVRDVLELEEEKEDRSDEDNEIDRDIWKDIEVLKDISGESTCTGEVDDFRSYFDDRFERLRSIIRERRDGKKARPINRIEKRSGEATVIGMIRDVYTSSNDNKVLTLEDDTGEIRGFISSDSEAYNRNLLEDEVILAKGQVWDNDGSFEDTFSIEEITRPGIPKLNNKTKADFSGKIAFVGDAHVGSDTFLREEWDEFISWINSDSGAAAEIEYLVLPGDLVDGIGIFPNQEEELDIIDIYKQYQKFADLIEEIPSDITVITIPGNHDIVRNAEPQPCLPEEIQDMFPDNVLFFGNPALMEIQGLQLLLYHGTSINDLSDILPQVTSEKPITAMKEMLDRRHLVPVYGESTPIAPEEKDHLVIEDIPDIFVTGHIHRTEVSDHHGIVMVNASTWQGQTNYQEMRDIQPDPAKVIVLDPGTNNVSIRDFS